MVATGFSSPKCSLTHQAKNCVQVAAIGIEGFIGIGFQKISDVLAGDLGDELRSAGLDEPANDGADAAKMLFGQTQAATLGQELLVGFTQLCGDDLFAA